jgi:hypothetical protein
MATAVDAGMVTLSYDQFLGSVSESIVITCSNWRNPILKTDQDGYKIRTYGQDGNLLV